jgi:hypothetical protein
MVHRLVSAASMVLLVVLGCALSGCGMNWARATRGMSQSVPHVSGSPVEVRTRNGAIEIVGDPAASDVSITAEFFARAATQAAAESRVAEFSMNVARDAAGLLTVSPVFPGEKPESGDGASFTIRLPDASGVTAKTGNGRVTIRRLAGALVVETSNGAVVVEDHDGPVNIDTSNGAVTVRGVTGAVTVDTSNGEIDVALAPSSEGPVSLDSSNGAITFAAGPAFRGELVFDTSNGRTTIDDPAGIVTLKEVRRNRDGRLIAGAGGEPSQIDTSNGAITIRFTN